MVHEFLRAALPWIGMGWFVAIGCLFLNKKK